MKILADATGGTSYNTEKYSLDKDHDTLFDYDDESNKIMKWKETGETYNHKKPVDLRDKAKSLSPLSTVISYYLDGSRHIYKVDDISYNHRVYPVMAGQIGVGCCKRVNGEMNRAKLYQRMVIALPRDSYADQWDPEGFFGATLKKLNESCTELKRFGLSFDKLITYEMPESQRNRKAESSGVSAIQDYMIDSEKEMVTELVRENKLNQNNYLIKDGSLEYKRVTSENSIYHKRDLEKIKNNYRYVIGVSKSFNPTSIKDYKNKDNADYIVNLPLFHRTPVAVYHNEQYLGDIKFGVWYLRIRDRKYTRTPFDGVLKIEKIMLNEEYEKGLNSDEVDLLSANIINDRTPTCFGTDRRWANHLYPVFLTESYVKCIFRSGKTYCTEFQNTPSGV